MMHYSVVGKSFVLGLGVFVLSACSSLESVNIPFVETNPEMQAVEEAAGNVREHLITHGLQSAQGYMNQNLDFSYMAEQLGTIEANYALVPESKKEEAYDYYLSHKVFYAAEQIERAYSDDEMDVMRETVADVTEFLNGEEAKTFLSEKDRDAELNGFLEVTADYEAALQAFLDGDPAFEVSLGQKADLSRLFNTSQAIINPSLVYGRGGDDVELRDNQ